MSVLRNIVSYGLMAWCCLWAAVFCLLAAWFVVVGGTLAFWGWLTQ